MAALGRPYLLSVRFDCQKADSANIRLRRNLDVFHLALRSRNRQSIFAETFEMKLNGLTNLLFGLFDGLPRGHTARKIRHIG